MLVGIASVFWLLNAIARYYFTEEKLDYKWWQVILALIAVLAMIFVFRVSTMRCSNPGPLTACSANLRNTGTALEMYSTDNIGRYPVSLDKIVPGYFTYPYLPQCPISDRMNYGYIASIRPDAYTVFCAGRNHDEVGLAPNLPAYSSTKGSLSDKEDAIRSHFKPAVYIGIWIVLNNIFLYFFIFAAPLLLAVCLAFYKTRRNKKFLFLLAAWMILASVMIWLRPNIKVPEPDVFITLNPETIKLLDKIRDKIKAPYLIGKFPSSITPGKEFKNFKYKYFDKSNKFLLEYNSELFTGTLYKNAPIFTSYEFTGAPPGYIDKVFESAVKNGGNPEEILIKCNYPAIIKSQFYTRAAERDAVSKLIWWDLPILLSLIFMIFLGRDLYHACKEKR